MSEQQQQFENMVLALSSPDNNVRAAAEKTYEETRDNNPAFLVQALIEVGCNSTNLPAAQMSLVLLRKNFAVPKVFDAIGGFAEAERNHIKSSLLSRFGDPNTPHGVRKACASAIASLAAKLSQDGRNAWPDLWDLLLRTAADDGTAPQLRAMCLEVFSQVATILVTTYFAPQLPRFVEMLGKALSNQYAPLRTKAIETVAEFVHVCTAEQMPLMRQVAINVVNAMVASNQGGDSDELLLQATQVRSIIDDSDVTFFQDVYPPLLEGLFNCAANNKLDADARHMCIGCVLSVGSATKALKNNQVFVKKLFQLLWQYMLHPEMDSDWETTYEKEEDEEKTTDFDAGAQGMDRLSQIVKGKAMEQLAAPVIMQSVQSDNWKERAAALTLLTYVFEGSVKAFMNHLDTIMNMVVIPRVGDPHPYVRYCAIQCITQLGSDLCPAFHEKYGAKVLPLICAKLENECPRIMTLAACSINSLMDELDDSKPDDEEEDNKVLPENERYGSTRFMNNMFGPIIDALFNCLKSEKPVFVHSECLAALSSTVQLAEARVRPFVDAIVACCQHYLSYPGSDADAQLIRCRAIEVTTLTASYVKKEGFPAARDVCNYLLDQIKSGMDSGNMMTRYILRGWTCMVECLGPDVLPYMNDVMRPLLEVASLSCDAETIEKDVGEEFEDTDEVKHVRIAVPGKGEKVLRMRTSLIEDKDLAATIILNITTELKGHMHPYLNDLVTLAIGLLQFQAMNETRETAAELLKALVDTVSESPERGNMDGFIRHIVPPLFAAIDEESEQDTVQVQLGALSRILEKGSVGVLSDDIAREAARMMFEIYELSVSHIEELQQVRGQMGNHADEDEMEELDAGEEGEADLLQDCATCIGQLLRIVPSFFQLFEEKFLPMTTTLLNPSLSHTQHQIAIHLLCEFVEHGGQNVARHLPSAIDTFSRFAQTDDTAVSQAAIYGLGCCVETSAQLPRNERIAQFVNQCNGLVMQFLNHPNSKNEDWFGVTINAVSLGLRIIKHYGDAVDGKKLFALIVEQHMPLSDDDDEIEVTRIHDLLARWICNNNDPLLGQGSPYRVRMLELLRNTRYISDEARNQVKQLQN
jgi:HEAT repeat protein